jgi:hypothetical protein
VKLHVGNIEICSRNYVASYHRIYFWINMLYKKGLVKSPHSQKCYIKMLINLSNCMQHVWIKKVLNISTYLNVYCKYLQTGHNLKFGDIFKPSKKDK